MGAVIRDLSIEQGVTWSAAWSVHIDGAPLDGADGWRARSQVRASKADPLVLHEFTATVTGSVVTLSVLPTDSSAWSWQRGIYDLEIYDNGNPSRVVRIVEGSVVVDAKVTRA